MEFSVAKNLNDVKRKSRPVFLESESYKTLRQGVERRIVDGIIHVELQSKKDSVHKRNSGMDDILARFMAKNRVSYVVDVQAVLESGDIDVVLGRVMQNIMLCKKYQTKVLIVNADFDREILVSFMESLGMTKSGIKEAMR